ncbi:MAG: recombination mediator RecR [bacterium]|nr:recombination mediator RecR [bacterium]
MAGSIPKSVRDLIEEFGKLPGIGPKTASRLTFYLLTKPEEDVERLAKSVDGLKKNLIICSECYNIAESDPCSICGDQAREKEKVCVVEEPLDVVAIEKTGFDGRYHVLGGVISPINGIGPENLRMAELFNRIKGKGVKEVILATDPSLEGEATAMYISNYVAKFKSQSASWRTNLKNLKVTRIARGLPVGGDLEYADEMTLTRALEGRKEY